MAKSDKPTTDAAADEEIAYEYVGDGAYVPGVPCRNFTQVEWDLLTKGRAAVPADDVAGTPEVPAVAAAFEPDSPAAKNWKKRRKSSASSAPGAPTESTTSGGNA